MTHPTLFALLGMLVDPSDVEPTAEVIPRREDDLPSAQRLGFLLEHVGQSEKADPPAKWIKSSRTRTILLRAGGPLDSGSKSARWKVIVNEGIEVPE